MSAASLPNTGLRRSKSVSPADDLALKKAAAWAWHQHSATRSARPVHPFETGAAAGSRCRLPSRYKLEAEAAAASCPSRPALTRRASLSLLDGYEIGRISSDLDSLILQARSQRQQPVKAARRPPRKSSGFWARHVAFFCGSKWSSRVSDAVLVPRPLAVGDLK